MKLAELNIVGFKSFAKKTNVVFHDGMTAIVGPNGCGKSNIVDAIRWVMGEQKSNVLRSEKMDNVIFAGSASAKPVGMAEVSLTIDNSSNLLPVDYTDVIITRRIFRSGESQYLVNGNQVRLKDINDMFMDTGMALGSYSVIELAQVERILNGKAEERRKIFEEAAGISKYKLRRKATFRKLEGTEKDLIRIEDIMSEVEKSVRSLKRQVNKAEKYQEYTGELKELEIKQGTWEYNTILQELEPLETKLGLIQDDRESVAGNLAQQEAEYESLRRKLLEIEKTTAEEQGQFNDLTKEIQKFEERILVNSERIRSLKETQERYSIERDSLVERVSELEKGHDEFNFETKNSRKELAAAQEEFNILNKEYEELKKEYETKRFSARDKEAQILRITEELSRKQNESERLKATEENLSGRLKQINDESEKHRSRLEELANKIAEMNAQVEDLAKTLEEKRIKNQIAQKAEEEARRSLEGLQKSDLQDKNRIEMLEHQAEMIKKILENYQDYPSGVRFLATLETDEFTSFGAVANHLRVKEELRPAIAAALGESATYLLVQDEKAAYEGIGLLQQDKKGIVSFLPLQFFNDVKMNQPTVSDLGIVGWANELAQCDNEYQPVINALLGSYLIVQDIETARRIYKEVKSQQINLVTLSGEVLGHWGVIRGGSHSKKQSEFVGRQEQLAALQKEIDGILVNIEKRQKIMAHRSDEATAAKNETAALTTDIKNIEESLASKRLELGKLTFEDQSLQDAKKEREEEKARLLNQVTQLDENLKAQDSTSQSLISERKMLSDQVEKLNKEVSDVETRLNEKTVKVQNTQVRVAKLQSSFESVQRELDSMRNQINNTKQMIDMRDQESTRATKEIDELTAINQEYDESVQELKENRSVIDTKLEALKEEQYQVNVKTDEMEKVIRSVRGKNESLAEQVHQSEMRVSELRLKRENLKARILEEYEYSLRREPIDKNYIPEESRPRIEELREKMKNFGPVNLLALKEFEQENERLEFLTTQRNDLLDAKRNLTETINKINNSAREQFLETFEKVQKNFTNVFKSFFEGGRASMVLREGNDPLEADIDIYATPGGKKLSSLQLLSGGEKSLTAISLLFAIYLVKPSPFCIFDEVDAPLDDKNVDRFSKAIQEFSKNTQFILVTHNKLTMKAANQMYGVTMEEKGISKVVSVKFDAEHKTDSNYVKPEAAE